MQDFYRPGDRVSILITSMPLICEFLWHRMNYLTRWIAPIANLKLLFASLSGEWETHDGFTWWRVIPFPWRNWLETLWFKWLLIVSSMLFTHVYSLIEFQINSIPNSKSFLLLIWNFASSYHSWQRMKRLQ